MEFCDKASLGILPSKASFVGSLAHSYIKYSMNSSCKVTDCVGNLPFVPPHPPMYLLCALGGYLDFLYQWSPLPLALAGLNRR